MKTFGTALVVLCLLLSPPVVSGMTVLGDRELATFHAGSGVSQDITGTALVNVGSYWRQDTDTGNKIELNNIVWDNGSGGGFSFSTPVGDPVTEDIGTNADGRTYVDLHDSTQVSPRTFSSDLSFCGQPLGSLKVSDIVRTENNLTVGAHAYGGIDFEYKEKTDIGYAQYAYNNSLGDNPWTTPVETNFALDSLTLNGIHLCGSATGLPEADPKTWTYSGPFQIGNIAGGNPAQIDIGTDAAGVTSVRYELPMAGSIRVENVNFGGSDFGPLALDGLTVHHLEIQFHP